MSSKRGQHRIRLRMMAAAALFISSLFGAAMMHGGLAAAAPAASPSAPPLANSTAGSEDTAATAYYRALEKNTPWLEQFWDPHANHYVRDESSAAASTADFNFAGVMGSAVLLNYGTYDPSLTGISRADLEAHTVSSIAYWASRNKWVNPNGEWGAKIYFDSTFESYFTDAAELMWNQLDPTTQANIDTIVRDEANYVVSLGTGDDLRSPGWVTNGLLGNFQGDTKLEEMGARTMPLATALAFLPSDPNASSWATWLDTWASNMDGLPVADQANGTVIDGQTVAKRNKAHNIYDTFIAENHGAYAPNYQEASGDYAGRDAAQFIIAGQHVPAILQAIPNDASLWDTLSQTGTDAGVAEDFAVADRHHLYGKNVLSLAYEDVVRHDPYQARAEQMLIDHLNPYQDFPPIGRLTKFSGQANYEPEARANVAQAYLLHYYRARFGPTVAPVSKAQYFAHESSVKDYGQQVGLLAQQTPNALTAAVTKPGFAKFAFLPQHDDWFLNASGSSPAMLPSTSMDVTVASQHAYHAIRDGYDASTTMVQTPNPDAGGTDVVNFPSAPVRYVRMFGEKAGTQYGYSLYSFEVRSTAGGPDLAQGQPTTASSSYPGYPPSAATDGDPTTRWANSAAGRSDPHGWLAVDLGHTQSVSQVTLDWQGTDAFGEDYEIQGSPDGQTWTTLATQDGTSGGGYAGYATLPTGAAVYATTGSFPNDGAISFQNMAMPGVPGLDGDRTFYGPDGSFTLSGESAPGDGNTDLVDFPSANARYVRMFGEKAGTPYGYSLLSFEVRSTPGGPDLAQGQPATASSTSDGFPASNATDGDPTTRWAVSNAGRSDPNSWLAVDLGSSQPVSQVTLDWQGTGAYGQDYEIQGSQDGQNWTTLATVPNPQQSTGHDWLNIDNRAGFVVRGSSNPIQVTPTSATLSAGPASGAAGMIVEEYPITARDTAAKAAAPEPTGGPASLRASLTDGYLTMFNLSGQPIAAAHLSLPAQPQPSLFLGTQTVSRTSSTYRVSLGAAQAAVQAPRFTLSWDQGSTDGQVNAQVIDSQHVKLSLPANAGAVGLTLTSAATGEGQHVQVTPGSSQLVTFTAGALTPTPNLATGMQTFPTSPLPAGSTTPALAVDANHATSWTPGTAGRMVVDLGNNTTLSAAHLYWTPGAIAPFDVEVSADGLNWTMAASSSGNDANTHHVALATTARYVAIQVNRWQQGDASLAELDLRK